MHCQCRPVFTCYVIILYQGPESLVCLSHTLADFGTVLNYTHTWLTISLQFWILPQLSDIYTHKVYHCPDCGRLQQVHSTHDTLHLFCDGSATQTECHMCTEMQMQLDCTASHILHMHGMWCYSTWPGLQREAAYCDIRRHHVWHWRDVPDHFSASRDH